MIKQLFFDTDGLSSFLWVKRENILLQLYPGSIILPQAVFNEFPVILNEVKNLSAIKILRCAQNDTQTGFFTFSEYLHILPPAL